MRAFRRKRTGAMMIAIVTVVAILAVFTPASAAQGNIVAGPVNASAPYYTPATVIQKGKTVNFINLDIALHNVQSGKPGKPTSLFKSASIGFFKQTPVAGVKNLKKGTYRFFCTFHPLMTGTLTVI